MTFAPQGTFANLRRHVWFPQRGQGGGGTTGICGERPGMLLNLLQGTTEPPQRGPTQLHWQPSRIRDHVLGQGPTTVLYTRTAEHYVCTYQPASAISGRLVSTYCGPQLGPSVLDIRSAPVCSTWQQTHIRNKGCHLPGRS